MYTDALGLGQGRLFSSKAIISGNNDNIDIKHISTLTSYSYLLLLLKM